MNIYTSRTYSHVIKNYTNYTKGRIIMIGYFHNKNNCLLACIEISQLNLGTSVFSIKIRRHTSTFVQR